MKSLYDITLGQKVIGKASIEEMGMYYLISCDVTLPTTIYLVGAETTVKLGGCYPVGNSFCLKTRLNKKMLQELNCKFIAQASPDGTIVDISKPINFLDALECAKIKKEGTYKKIYYE